eukprot:TsM_000366500 transcript=TsM_000366500 gene=TsM_000366500
MLSKEVHEYDNLPVSDHEDSYDSLTLKLFHRFQWAARFRRPHKLIVIFIDDDCAVNANKSAAFVCSLTSGLRGNLNYGCEVMLNPVF